MELTRSHLPFFLLLTFLITQSFAWQCYRCKGKKECENPEVEQCAGASHMCYKRVDEDIKATIAKQCVEEHNVACSTTGCHPVTEVNFEGKISYKYNVTECYCDDEELCNGSRALMPSNLVFYIGLGYIIVTASIM